MKALNKLIKYVDKFNISVPYFIAGGACVDILNGVKIDDLNDIDIFFKNEDDLNEFKSCMTLRDISTTDNAYTYEYYPKAESTSNLKIQLIRCNFGTPEEVLSTFDLNKSCVSIDSNYNVYTNNQGDLQIIFENFSIASSTRLLKYQEMKGLYLPPSSVCDCIDHLTNNLDTEYEDYYNKNRFTFGKSILNSFMYKIKYKLSREDQNVIMDKFPELYI